MVHGVVSLRCPKCARPFLSLPQPQGAMVTCPHCAHSAAMSAYPAASGPLGQGSSVSLPIQRRIIPARPEVTASSIWPPAPEQPPAHAAPQSYSPFPPAPPAQPSWPPVMQAPLPPQAPPSPFGVASQPQQSYVPPLEPVPHMPAFAAPPPPQAAPPAFTLPPQQTAPEYGRPQSAPVAEPPMRRGVPDFSPAPSWQPPAPKSRAPAIFLTFFCLTLVGGATWYLMQSPLAAEFQAPSLTASVPAATDSKVPSSSPASIATVEKGPALSSTSTSPTSTPRPVAKEPEVRRAEVIAKAKAPEVRIDLVVAAEAAETQLKKLLSADQAKERLALISEGEDHAVDVAEFFERSHPRFISVKLAEAQPRTLPGQETRPLFLVKTNKNPTQGSLLALVPETEDRFLLDWPLFAETHERRLAHFLEKPTSDPAWFHVLLRRSHGLELPEAERKQHFCVEIITTADGSVPCVARVKLDSPLGRFLEREMVWQEDYVARLLLQHPPKPDGESAIILDCEGAVMGAAFPSGSR